MNIRQAYFEAITESNTPYPTHLNNLFDSVGDEYLLFLLFKIDAAAGLSAGQIANRYGTSRHVVRAKLIADKIFLRIHAVKDKFS